jgi:hypothetical protein
MTVYRVFMIFLPLTAEHQYPWRFHLASVALSAQQNILTAFIEPVFALAGLKARERASRTCAPRPVALASMAWEAKAGRT